VLAPAKTPLAFVIVRFKQLRLTHNTRPGFPTLSVTSLTIDFAPFRFRSPIRTPRLGGGHTNSVKPCGVRSRLEEKTVQLVAGVDLGGTAINYTLVNREEQFLIEGLCEHPALSKQGPEICLQQIVDGLKIAADQAGVALEELVATGLDTPGPASAAGLLSARGSTNFVHPKWAGFDIREGLAHKLGKPVSYLNDGNAAALWGHYTIFGANSRETSVSTIIGTGNGGGVILDGSVVKGKNGFGGELGHVLIPYQSIAGTSGIKRSTDEERVSARCAGIAAATTK